jgi:hypothetical protein
MLDGFFNAMVRGGQIQVGIEFPKMASEFLSKSVNRVWGQQGRWSLPDETGVRDSYAKGVIGRLTSPCLDKMPNRIEKYLDGMTDYGKARFITY